MSLRLERVREVMRRQELDAVLVSLPANRFHLSGFPDDDDGPDESSGVLVVGRTGATLYTGATNAPWAKGTVGAGIGVEAWERPWEASVGKRWREAGWRRVGFEDEALTVAAHGRLAEAAGDGVTLVAVGEAVSRGRSAKDDEEIAILERALRITDEAFVAATSGLAAGVTERELARRIEDELRRHGADGPAFPTIVASGPHAARPHHDPTERAIGVGEPVIIDMGARWAGYAGDLTRTVWVGDPTPRLRDLYTIVAEAQRAAVASLRPGISGKEADAAARAVIEAAGMGDAFVHGLGHGLGIRVHEAPSLGKASTDLLAVGDVVTVEPGVYFEEWGGVRIEDVAVIVEDGCRVLTTAPKR